jgi:indole-3-glycerol phosphate synthase
VILDDIVAHKRIELANTVEMTPLADIERQALAASTPRDFRAALARPGMSLIAEIKRSSPTKGLFTTDFQPTSLARQYEAAGARAISVLTDHKYFGGSLADLASVRASVSLPCLRKDFLFDPYQVLEARANDADAVLLIVSILDDATLRNLRRLATDLGMASLVEVHTEDELDRALAADADIIGVNNRDLRTFEVDIRTTERLRRRISDDRIVAGLSGIHTRADVELLESWGVAAMLVGESLMRSGDVVGKVAELLG